MRKQLVLFSLALPTGVFASCVDFYADYLYVTRHQNQRNSTLVRNTTTGKPAIKNDTLVNRMHNHSAVEGGMNITFDTCNSMDLVYTYYFPWKVRKTALAPNSLAFPFLTTFTNDFRLASGSSVFYESWLQNAEINYWRYMTPKWRNYFSFAWDLGARFLYLKEQMNLTFTRGLNNSHYDVHVRNLLFGGQFGALLDWRPYIHWRLTFMGKIGVFADVGRKEEFLGDLNDTITLRNDTRCKTTASFVYDGKIQLAYELGGNLDVHGGFQALLIRDVLLAPRQLDRTPFPLHPRYDHEGAINLFAFYAGFNLYF